jgi:flagellar M-ring protein FliF
MATGIQTGIRRGSRVTPTQQQQQPSLWGVISSRWSALSARSRTAIIAAAILFQVSLLGAGLFTRQTALVDLYPTKLSAEELPLMSLALLAENIEHEVTPASDGLLVNRAERLRARAILADKGLPERQDDKIQADMRLTADQRKQLQRERLEREIALALRGMDGVRSAKVLLAVPETNYFLDKEPTRASVTIGMQAGRTLDSQSIAGMIHLVAFSVPGLAPENVRLIDTHGTDLTPATANQSGGVSSLHLELRSAEESRLQEKVQRALERRMPGRTEVVVSLEMDFSELEKRLYTPGSEQDDGVVASAVQSISETYGNRSNEKDMESKKKSVNYKIRENYIASLTRHARTERLTATVFADGISEKEAETMKEAVAVALGIQADRGDSVFVDRSPWDRDMVEPTPGDPSPPLAETEGQATSWNGYLLTAMLAQMALMAAGFGYLHQTRRSRPAGGVEVSSPPGLRTATIVDHGHSKSGQSLQDQTGTAARTTERLESLRPNQMADLLRSTWLAN